MHVVRDVDTRVSASREYGEEDLSQIVAPLLLHATVK